MTTGHNASSVNGGKGGKGQHTQSTMIMNRKQFEFEHDFQENMTSYYIIILYQFVLLVSNHFASSFLTDLRWS